MNLCNILGMMKSGFFRDKIHTNALTQHTLVIFRPTENWNFEKSLFLVEFDFLKLVVVVVSLSQTG